MSWENDLTPDEDERWNAFVKHFREDALSKMTESAFVMHLVPSADHFDVKFAVELGASIMLDKPMMAVVMPGAEVPPKMRAVCDQIVELDMDTEDGRKKLQAAITKMMDGIRA